MSVSYYRELHMAFVTTVTFHFCLNQILTSGRDPPFVSTWNRLTIPFLKFVAKIESLSVVYTFSTKLSVSSNRIGYFNKLCNFLSISGFNTLPTLADVTCKLKQYLYLLPSRTHEIIWFYSKMPDYLKCTMTSKMLFFHIFV